MNISEFPLPSAAVSQGTVFSWCKAPVQEINTLEFLRKRALIQKDDVERALFMCCGGFAGVEADREIFRNRMAPGAKNGLLVNLNGEIICPDPAFRIWRCNISGVGSENFCSRKFSQITGKIPLPCWLKVSSPILQKDVIIASLKIADEKKSTLPVSGESAEYNMLVLEAAIYCGF